MDDTTAAVRSLARAARLLERSTGELSLAQYRVLSAVASGDQRASRIALKLALGKPTISATVDSLTQRHLLERTVVEGDQRATALSVTTEGATVLADVEATMGERLEQLVARRSDPSAVLRALAELGEAIDDLVAERSPEWPPR